jgi:hypothetical protein
MRRLPVSRRLWQRVIAHSVKRTGSPYGVSTYFPKGQGNTVGPRKVYVRGSDAGRQIEIHFCTDCGSSVFRYAKIGQTLSALPLVRSPIRRCSVRETTRDLWVTFDHHLNCFPVRPKIDDFDLERLSHAAVNVHNAAL